MLLDVIYSICFNICLLVVLAFMMTKMDFVQRLLLNEEGGSEEGRGENVWQRLWEKVLLGVIFGIFCIISDYIGIQVTGALPNARVIGVLSAGFLGGPVSGFITTAIAAAHRYLIFPERISTVACVLSAIIHGIIGSFIGWKKKENRQYSNTFLLGVTFISEMIHIVLILLLTRPFDAAVEIVKIVIVPMVIINSVGMVIFFNVFKSIFNTEDLKVASKVSLAMRTAERCTPYLGSVENDRKTAGRIIDIIMEEYHCQGAALIDDMKFLARSGAFSSIVLTENNYPRLLSATKTFKTTRISRVPLPEDGFYPLYKENVIISAPILLDEGKVLALVMLVKKNAYSYRADIEFVTGLANHFAMQIKLSEMEKQKEELRKAELRTLQSQINPHFLYNTLDSVVWMTENGRTQEAVVMLTALARFFRISLSKGSNIIPIGDEIEHARNYLTIQKMRYKNKFSADISVEPGVEKLYTIKLIIQPILENAIYHGMEYADGDGEIHIRAFREGETVVIEVEDNGPGMSEEIVEQLLKPTRDVSVPKAKGSGIGFRNVHQRIQLTFGAAYGLTIRSEPDNGTVVRICLPVLEEEDARKYRKEGER